MSLSRAKVSINTPLWMGQPVGPKNFAARRFLPIYPVNFLRHAQQQREETLAGTETKQKKIHTHTERERAQRRREKRGNRIVREREHLMLSKNLLI